MSELSPEQTEHIETTLGRALADPMPRELHRQIADLIEPHTINMELKHGDVMLCIKVAFPVIRDWIALDS